MKTGLEIWSLQLSTTEDLTYAAYYFTLKDRQCEVPKLQLPYAVAMHDLYVHCDSSLRMVIVSVDTVAVDYFLRVLRVAGAGAGSNASSSSEISSSLFTES